MGSSVNTSDPQTAPGQTAPGQTAPGQTAPEDPLQKRLLASNYEVIDAINNLAQRIFAQEAELRTARGELEEIRQLLVKVQPERLVAVAEALDQANKRGLGARVKRVLRAWLED